MSFCPNINSPEYKSLIEKFDSTEKAITHASIIGYMHDNKTHSLPSESDLREYINTKKTTFDLKSFHDNIRSFVKSYLPSISNEEMDKRLRFIDSMNLMRMREGREVLGSFINSTVYLSNALATESQTVQFQTAKHEVFHMVFNNLLSEDERNKIIRDFNRTYPEYSSLDNDNIEELLANKFEDYSFNHNKSFSKIIKDFFNALLEFIGFVSKSYNDIESLFNDLESGKFRRNKFYDSNAIMDKNILVKYFDENTDLFINTQNFILDKLNLLLNPVENPGANPRKYPRLYIQDDILKDKKGRNNFYPISLTKSEAINVLHESIKLTDASTLDGDNRNIILKLQNDKLFKDFMQYLYPSIDFKINKDGVKLTLSQDKVNNNEEDTEGEELIDNKNDFDLKDEIEEKVYKDPKSTISETVKDFLSSLFYNNNDNVINVDPRVGFITLLKLINNINSNDSLLSKLNMIKSNLKSYFNIDAASSGLKEIQQGSVFLKIKELIESIDDANSLIISKDLTSNESFKEFKENAESLDFEVDINDNNILVKIPDNISIETIGTNSIDYKIRFLDNKNNKIIYKEKEESVKDYLDRLQKETKIPVPVLIHLYNIQENKNTLTSLFKVANSLRETSPRFTKVVTSTEFIDEQRVTRNRTLFVKYRDLKDTFETSANIENSLNHKNTLYKFVAKANELELELKKSSGNVDIIVNDILKNIFKVLPTRHLPYNTKKAAETIVAMNSLLRVHDEDFSIDSFIQENGGYINDLSDVVESAIGKKEVNSYRTSEKKSKWYMRVSNFLNTTINNIKSVNNKVISPSQLLEHLKNSTDNYLKFNHFVDVNGKNVIIKNLSLSNEDLADIEETYFDNKKAFFKKVPVRFRDETQVDWLRRNFLAQFVFKIIENKSNSNSYNYFQQFYQPSDKPNTQAAPVKLLSESEILSSIEKAILQEAYMAVKANQGAYDDYKNLKKNNTGKKSYMPGLENEVLDYLSTHRFFDENFNRINSKINSALITELVNKVYDNLTTSSDDFTLDYILKNKLEIQGSNLISFYNKIKTFLNNDNLLSNEEYEAVSNLAINNKTKIEDLSENSIKGLSKIVRLWYGNNFVNGLFLNQLVSGVHQNFKSSVDQIKRMAGTNAIGESGLVDEKFGLRPKSKVLVVQGVNAFIAKSNNYLANFKGLKNKAFEISDAQGFSIPEIIDEIRQSQGRDSNLGSVIKPVHNEVNKDGANIYLKFSSATLTNELVRAFPDLKEIRFQMTFEGYLNSLTNDRENTEKTIRELYDRLVNNDSLEDNPEDFFKYRDFLRKADSFRIDHMLFDSAVKSEKPSKLSSLQIKNNKSNLNIVPESIIEINNNHFRIQQNPRKRAIDKFISHFTQLTYLVDSNGKNRANLRTIQRELSKLNKIGLSDIKFKMRMDYDNNGELKINTYSRSKFRDLLKKLVDSPGNERIVEFLNSKVSLNAPLITEKLVELFSNNLSKNTVKPKHAGGKFVLQSEVGTLAKNIITNRGRNFEYTTPVIVQDPKTGKPLYAECYLPDMYSQQLSTGNTLYYDNPIYNQMFGFRIPSSDLHSAVPLKVKGFYPSNTEDNIVIIPSAVVAIHGADFDVDSLFVVRPAVSDENLSTKFVKKNNNYINIAQKGIKSGYIVSSATYNGDGNITSFGDNEHQKINNIDNILIEEKDLTKKEILNSEKEQIKHATGTPERVKIDKKIKDLDTHLDKLSELQKNISSNTILDSMWEVINYSSNNVEDLFTGVSFDVFKSADEEAINSKLARKNGFKIPFPTVYKSLGEAKQALGDKTFVSIVQEAQTFNLDSNDTLEYINNSIMSDWASKRDEFIQGKTNLDKVEDHLKMHQDNFVAKTLVGVIANFTKGVSYLFHSTDKIEDIDLDESVNFEIDGHKINQLTRNDFSGNRNQEFASSSLNAAIDHVKEQIFNNLNVNKKTIKIYMSAVFTKLNPDTISWIMLQPVTKEFGKDSVNKVGISTIRNLLNDKLNEVLKLKELANFNLDSELAKINITTDKLYDNIDKSIEDLNDIDDILFQIKTLDVVEKLQNIGNNVSDFSRGLSVIQSLPYNMVDLYNRFSAFNKFFKLDKLFQSFNNSEEVNYKAEDYENQPDNIFKNVKLINSENIISSLEVSKFLMDANNQLFAKYHPLMQKFLNNIFSAITGYDVLSNLDTVFSDENNRITTSTAKNIPYLNRYIKDKADAELLKKSAEDFFNYLMTGIKLIVNNNSNTFDFSLRDQDFVEVEKKNGDSFILGSTRAFLEQFLDSSQSNKPSNYLKSQINPNWRIKPLSQIKRENPDNFFLSSLQITKNYDLGIETIKINSNLYKSEVDRYNIQKEYDNLKTIRNIYITQDKTGSWTDVDDNEVPFSNEMSELQFNLFKYSIYVDGLSFASNRFTQVIPAEYFVKMFKTLDQYLNNLLYYNKNKNSDKKFFKDYENADNRSNSNSALNKLFQHFMISQAFFNTSLLPEISSMPKEAKTYERSKTADGIYYDLKIVGSAFINEEDNTSTNDVPSDITTDESTSLDNDSDEQKEENSDVSASESITKKYKQRPTFIQQTDNNNPNKSDIFVRVSVDDENKIYYYKKIGNFSKKLNNFVFDPNVLSTGYKISDYFNPKLLYIATSDSNILNNTSNSLTITTNNYKLTDPKLIDITKPIGIYNAKNPTRRGIIFYDIVSVKSQQSEKNARVTEITLNLDKSNYQIDESTDNIDTSTTVIDADIQTMRDTLKTNDSFNYQESLSDDEIKVLYKDYLERESIKEQVQKECE